MRILGIDPGVATIGFGLVEADRAQVHMVTYGAITTPAGLPLSRRLYQIDRDMEELIGKLKPDVMAVEELFFNTNLTTGIAGEAAGHGHDQAAAAPEGRAPARRRRRCLGLGPLPRKEFYFTAPSGRGCEGDHLTAAGAAGRDFWFPFLGRGACSPVYFYLSGGSPCFTIWTAPWRRSRPFWR